MSSILEGPSRQPQQSSAVTASEALTLIACRDAVVAETPADIERRVYGLSRVWPVDGIALNDPRYCGTHPDLEGS